MRWAGRQGDLTEEQQELLTAVMYLRHRGRHEQILVDMLSNRNLESGTAASPLPESADYTNN
jgi:hypothetical protein